jgi:hypothetical protein
MLCCTLLLKIQESFTMHHALCMQCDFQCYCASASLTLSCCRITTQLLYNHIPSLVSSKCRILRITDTHSHTHTHTNYNFQKSQTKINVLKRRQSVALCSIWRSKTQSRVDTSLKSLLMLYYPV